MGVLALRAFLIDFFTGFFAFLVGFVDFLTTFFTGFLTTLATTFFLEPQFSSASVSICAAEAYIA